MVFKPETQGYRKMVRYIQDLTRNEVFLKELGKLKKLKDMGDGLPRGQYEEWSEEEKKQHDLMNEKLSNLVGDYEKLRIRAQKLMEDEYFDQQIFLAEQYGLDMPMRVIAEEIIEKREHMLDFYALETDMCRVEWLLDDSLYPANPGEEIIYMQPPRQMLYHAYPVAIVINIRAAKRDVIDYIEKRWSWIKANMIVDKERPLKFGKRKHSQDVLDFIWDNRNNPPPSLKAKLDREYPGNGMVYYELQEIIRQEKKRRTKDLS